MFTYNGKIHYIEGIDGEVRRVFLRGGKVKTKKTKKK